jgi:hypothetical protein
MAAHIRIQLNRIDFVAGVCRRHMSRVLRRLCFDWIVGNLGIENGKRRLQKLAGPPPSGARSFRKPDSTGASRGEGRLGSVSVWRVTRSGSLNAGEPRDNKYFVL